MSQPPLPKKIRFFSGEAAVTQATIEGIPDKDYNYFFGNDKFSNLYKRLLHERKLK